MKRSELKPEHFDAVSDNGKWCKGCFFDNLIECYNDELCMSIKPECFDKIFVLKPEITIEEE